MKKIMKVIILLVLLYNYCIGQTYANNNLKVYLFDELINMDNPVIINGNTLVPLRVLFESLGASVTWDDQTKTIKANKGDTDLTIQIGNINVTKNGTTITLEEPANIINDKTYVPLRFVAESFNQDVKWDKDNYSIYIGKSLNAKEVSNIASPAVVYIETYDRENKPFASGSGFIIDKQGIIVTNYHVIDGGLSAIIRLKNGKSLSVSKVIDYSVEMDIAILKVETYDVLPTVHLGNSDKINSGDKIFAIGSPRGLEDTISTGIISNTKRLINEQQLIQLSAEITHGSSGGALLNDRGEVIGITSKGKGEADLNFAVPINNIMYLDKNKSITFHDLFQKEHVIYYNNAIYVGDKKNDLPYGIGLMHWNNGEEYLGDFVKGIKHGKGKYTWPDGGSYEGEFVNGFKQGYGKEINSIGTTYEGQFSENLANGKGKLIYPSGDYYIGNFLNGLFDGEGVYTYFNGQTRIGKWSNGNYITQNITQQSPNNTAICSSINTRYDNAIRDLAEELNSRGILNSSVFTNSEAELNKSRNNALSQYGCTLK